MRLVIGSLLLIAASSGCLPAVSASPQQPTWVAIIGPSTSSLTEDLSLEIGRSAWGITASGGLNGVVILQIHDPARVELLGVTTCRRYASFEALAGSAHLIHFLPDGTVRVEDMAGQALAYGPGMVEAIPTGC